MPHPGSHYQLPNRDQILCPELWKAYKDKTKSDITYQEFTKIVKASNKKIFDAIVEDADGFKLPENLGYLCVIKYKTKKKAINWAATKQYGKRIYYLNLHSFGYRYHIKWFKTGISRFAFNEIYKFAPLRDLRTAVSKSIKAEKQYNEWNLKDFWDFNKLEKLVHKKLKTQEDGDN